MSKRVIRNPPGFYIHVLEDNLMPPKPVTTQTSRAPRAAEPVVVPDEEYRSYKEALVDQHIAANIGVDRFEEMVGEKARELKRTVGSLKPETIKQVSIATIRGMLLKAIPHATAEEFNAGEKAA